MTQGHHHGASLRQDLDTLLRHARRRDVLRLLGAASLFPLLGCGAGAEALGASADGGATSSAGTDGGTTGGTCTSVPEETAGPYPGDGSNGTERARDLRHRPERHPGEPRRLERSGGRGPAHHHPTLVNPVSGCAPVAGAAVYLWH